MSVSRRERILILGAAGRDFHNFNMCFRNDPMREVVGFTATQIPEIAGRRYPPELAGPLYPKGLPIWEETELETIIRDQRVDTCIISYSDLPHTTVMTLACRCQSAGADFRIISFHQTMLKSCKPVIAVTAVRTGCGKSQTTRYVCQRCKANGKRPVVVRHPMPYGDLAKQACQRFATYDDLIKHKVTIEEREEYEQHIDAGFVVYAGVDYEMILREAEKEADIVIWDGGNNDTPFFKPGVWIVVADPLRPGHEMSYYPGDVNFRSADIIVINKVNSAKPEAVASIQANAKRVNPNARVILADSEVFVDKPEVIKDKVCVTVEDGPTLTHGEMTFGAGAVAAQKYGAKKLIDPKPYALGSIKATYEKYTHVGDLIPAMGYFPQQIKDLEDTINKCPVESVIVATPMNLSGLIKINIPFAVVKYELADKSMPPLSDDLDRFLKSH